MQVSSRSCQSNKQVLAKGNLKRLVDEYIRVWGESYKSEDEWWGEKRITWEEAIARAWASRLSDGKMHGHQRRVANKLVEGMKVALADKKRPEDFSDFQSVLDWLESVVARVNGLGATTAYDVARRIGAWLGLEPAVVYLHAGTADGARRFGVRGKFASISVFSHEVQKLGATHAENFLCIYKDQIDVSAAQHQDAPATPPEKS